jgi:hypothetical protein
MERRPATTVELGIKRKEANAHGVLRPMMLWREPVAMALRAAADPADIAREHKVSPAFTRKIT